MGGQWHVVTDLADPHVNLAVSHADRMIYSDIWIKTHVYLWRLAAFIEPRKGGAIDLGYFGQ